MKRASRWSKGLFGVVLFLIVPVALEAAQKAATPKTEWDDVPWIRPREEGTFPVKVGATRKGTVKVVGQIAGRQLVEISSPGRVGNMGKLMVVDPEGYIWFLETREDKAVKINPHTLEMTEYYLPRGSGPYSHAVDSKGIHWITAHGIEMLLEFDPKKLTVKSHAAPTFGFLIHVNILPPNDTVFFSQPGSNRVVSYHEKKGFREYDLPTTAAGPSRIDFDSKGNVWFPQLYNDKITRLEPESGKMDHWDLPIKHGTPSFCRVDKEDAVWISLPMKDRILRFKDGQFRDYAIPTSGSLVSTTVTDSEGFIWFTEGGWRGSAGGNKIGRLDPKSGDVLEIALETPNAQPLGIVQDREGVMWFEMMNAGKVGRLGPPIGQPAKSKKAAR